MCYHPERVLFDVNGDFVGMRLDSGQFDCTENKYHYYEPMETIHTDNTQTLYHALAKIEELEAAIQTARDACGDFVNVPYDGSLATAIQAISMRCGAAEKSRDEQAQCIEEMREALEYGYSWFAEYATYHAINNKKEKSERNRARADKLRAVLEKWRKK
jgi:hypothetical protein